MQYRRLGTSGLLVSELSYGSWLSIGDRSEAITAAASLMTTAYDAGVNFFDNAECYGRNGRSEEVMGEVLASSGWSRDSYLVSSKAYFGCHEHPRPNQWGLSRKHLVEACHQALRRLRLDYLDLFYCHRPDPRIPMAEIVGTMSDLIRQGKILYWGTSEWPADLIRDAHRTARELHGVAPVVEQPQYSLVVRDRVEREYAPLCAGLGMGLTTWSPLASGILTGKYRHGIPADSRLGQSPWLRDLMEGKPVNGMPGNTLHQVAPILAIADAAGIPPARFAIAWCLRQASVSSVILGATRQEQLLDNLRASEVVAAITPDVAAAVDRALAPFQAPPEPSPRAGSL